MNKRIAAKGLTVVMTLMLSITSIDLGSHGGMTAIFPPNLPVPKIECDNNDAYRTGAQREDSRFIFFSQHQFEYHCLICGENFWKDEHYSFLYV